MLHLGWEQGGPSYPSSDRDPAVREGALLRRPYRGAWQYPAVS